MAASDFELLRSIPGYKAILKAVLKSQIQMMVQQLSDHTGEESIILSASINDGSLSHLGSDIAKGFLEGREEIKSQFLSHCLKSHHQYKIQESSPSYSSSGLSSPNQQNQSPSANQSLSKRKKTHPVPLAVFPGRVNQRSSLGSPSYYNEGLGAFNNQNANTPNSFNDQRVTDVPSNYKTSDAIKSNFSVQNAQPTESLDFPAVSSARQDVINGQSESTGEGQSLVPGSTDAVQLKYEPMGDEDEELVITGVQTGETNPRLSTDSWHQPQSATDMSYGQSTAEGDSLQNMSADQSGYDSSYNESMEKLSSHMASQAQQQQQTPERPRKGRPSLNIHGNHSATGTKLGNGYVKCNLCGKVLRETSMMTHQQAHMGIKNHECDYCGKKFSQKGPLVTHRRLHTGERPYSCPRCHKRFAAKSGLNQHAPRCRV